MVRPVDRNANRIVFDRLDLSNLLAPIAAIHGAITAGFQDIVLDFQNCRAALSAPMLALCVQVMKLRATGIEFEVLEPRQSKLGRLFYNANWLHLMEPSRYAKSAFKGSEQIPATQFRNAEEQISAVNQIVNRLLGTIPDLERRQLAAFEWSLTEITDNVLTHSASSIGGLVQLSTFSKGQKTVEYVVADAGLGIPKTLRPSRREITSDGMALESAIKEGVTRDKNIGQGNGLFGTFQVCSHSQGSFQLESGFGKLQYDDKLGLQVKTEKVPFDGTLVIARISLDDPQLLAEALKFGGRVHEPMDYVELKYEQHPRPELIFFLKEEAVSTGTRPAGTPVRNKLLNLLRMSPGQTLIIDFGNLPIISSSFADEVFGKLFVILGPLTFAQRLQFQRVTPLVQQLMDKAITQRMVSGFDESESKSEGLS